MTEDSSITLTLHSLQLPFSNTWKYGILAIAILLLLVALTILACQVCQLQKRHRARKKKKYHSEDRVRIKAENGFWGKMPPLLLDTSKASNADFKMTELQAGPDEPHFCPSCSTTEDPSNDGGPLPSSRGKLKFSLLYRRERCELLVSGLEAWGLPGCGHTGSAVRARLLQEVPSRIPGLQCVVQEWRSRVVKSCSRPAFGDHFVCSLRDAEVEKSTLKLEVQRFDKYSRNAALGEVRVALRELKASRSLAVCAELQKTTKDIVGEVLVSLKCLPISQRIEVGLLKVKTTPTRSTADVYARIDVSCRRHRQKHQKSRPRAHTPLIIFNETFLFHMPEPPAWDCTVLVSIYQVGSDPRHLIGQAAVGKSRAREASDHWDLVKKSIQQPVAKWHPLLV